MSLEKNNNKIDHVAHDTISFLVTFISACISFWNPFFLAQLWVWPGYKSCLNCFTAGSLSYILTLAPVLVPNSIEDVLFQG